MQLLVSDLGSAAVAAQIVVGIDCVGVDVVAGRDARGIGNGLYELARTVPLEGLRGVDSCNVGSHGVVFDMAAGYGRGFLAVLVTGWRGEGDQGHGNIQADVRHHGDRTHDPSRHSKLICSLVNDHRLLRVSFLALVEPLPRTGRELAIE